MEETRATGRCFRQWGMFSQHRGNGFGSHLVYSNSLDSSAEYQDCYSPGQWLELNRLILSYSFRRQRVAAAHP